MWSARLLALVLLAPLPAAAEEAPWGDVAIAYDSSVWRPAAGMDGHLTLACIAPDCPDGAEVYADIASPGDIEGRTWRSRRPVLLENPAIPFTVVDLWSGCRALDQPILHAEAIHGGRLYRLTTSLGVGCNYGPAVPVARFTALVAAIRPASPAATGIAGRETVRLAGIAIAYDTGRWQVAPANPLSPKAGADGTEVRRFTCIASDCRDHPMLAVTASPTDADRCAATEPGDGYSRALDPLPAGIDAAGLGLHGRMFTSMCRARTPARVTYCGRKDGVTYTFTSGFSAGCGGVEGVPLDMFHELLAGVLPLGG